MSILIKGMEMPKVGNWKTIRIYYDGTCAEPNWQGDCKYMQGCEAVPVPKQRITNADRIRAMNDEELANVMYRGCPPIKVDRCPTKKDGGTIDCVGCWLEWLKQEMK